MEELSEKKHCSVLTEEEFLDVWFDWGEKKDFINEYTPGEMVAFLSNGKFIPLSAMNEEFYLNKDIELVPKDSNDHNNENGKVYSSTEEHNIDSVTSSFYFISQRINFYKNLSVVKRVTSVKQLLIIPNFMLKGNKGTWEFDMELDESNEPIYKANTYNDSGSEAFGIEFGPFNDKESLQQKITDYIKFFFYNVAGRHGKFWIVDNTKFHHCSDVNLILNFGNEEFVDYQMDKSKWILNDEKAEDLRKKQEKLDKLLTGELLKIEIPEDIDEKTESVVIKNVYMFFKDSLFTADVILTLINHKGEDGVPFNKGQLSLSNEELIAEINKD